MNHRCLTCGEAGVAPAGRRDVAFDGLPGTLLEGLEVFRCSACGDEGLAYPALSRLSQRLAHEVAHRPGRLSGVEIRFLRTHVGWVTPADFARNFGTEPGVVSEWEGGAQPMDVHAELLLRVLAVRCEPGDDPNDLELEDLERLLARPRQDPVEAVKERRLRFTDGRWMIVGETR